MVKMKHRITFVQFSVEGINTGCGNLIYRLSNCERFLLACGFTKSYGAPRFTGLLQIKVVDSLG